MERGNNALIVQIHSLAGATRQTASPNRQNCAHSFNMTLKETVKLQLKGNFSFHKSARSVCVVCVPLAAEQSSCADLFWLRQIDVVDVMFSSIEKQRNKNLSVYKALLLALLGTNHLHPRTEKKNILGTFCKALRARVSLRKQQQRSTG